MGSVSLRSVRCVVPTSTSKYDTGLNTTLDSQHAPVEFFEFVPPVFKLYEDFNVHKILHGNDLTD